MAKFKNIFIVLAILSLSFSCVLFCQETPRVEYKIGPKDLLVINVVSEAGYPLEFRVTEDGLIKLPDVGEINIDGLTIAGAENIIVEKLEEGYIANPQVIIFIKEYKSRVVRLLGAVSNPDSYILLGRKTLREIIAEAGGFTPEAGDEIIVIRHNKEGASRSLTVSRKDINGSLDLNLPLQAGDIVEIPPDKILHIFVGGEVRRPDMYEIRKSSSPTLLQAVIQAGYFTERGSKGGVLLKRKNEDGVEETKKINVGDIEKGKIDDIPLKDGDVIIVPASIF